MTKHTEAEMREALAELVSVASHAGELSRWTLGARETLADAIAELVQHRAIEKVLIEQLKEARGLLADCFMEFERRNTANQRELEARISKLLARKLPNVGE